MRELALHRSQRYRLRQQLKHTRDASLYRRTLALVELDKGKPLAQVARSLGVTRQTVYNWIEAYT
jgi:predicted transcriptional regulator